ncbi:Pex35p SPAR_G03820 [Saccharomyces paradoxus]|uniref:Pex35p n=1 Tax=Saccharomyces paradoxus TaxID=27291 RepID=A0A8B8URY5_SACPA|nr:uncharacterized protein SPAR_G03820 [Saccharomyces paradoxus]QHS73472.1 hypothetical protein SPAR_G03820 [Saccharomyces paradoxus]
MKHSRSNGTGTAVSGFKKILRQLLLFLNKKRREQLVIILKRITQVYGMNLIFYVNKWKMKKLQGENLHINDIMSWLRESAILVLLNILYPTLVKLPFLKNDYIHWSSIVGVLLMLTMGEVPSWVIAHFLVEALHSKFKDSKLTQWLKKKRIPQGTLIKFQQIFLCSAVVVLFAKLDRSSLPFCVLFDHRSFSKDFFTINAIFTVLAIYRRISKFFFTSGTKSNKSGYSQEIRDFSQLLGVKNHNDWPISSSNLKHVMDRLNEIHEVTIEDNYANFNEKLINSCFIKGFFPSLKWTILRQCIEYLFVTKRRRLMNNKLRCIVMLLTFTLIDPTSKMKISPFFVKLLAKSLVNVYLKKYWHSNFQKYVLFFLFQFNIT